MSSKAPRQFVQGPRWPGSLSRVTRPSKRVEDRRTRRTPMKYGDNVRRSLLPPVACHDSLGVSKGQRQSSL